MIYWLLTILVFTENPVQGMNSQTSIMDVVYGAIYYNIVPLLVSLVVYLPIVRVIQRVKLSQRYRLLITGIILTLTTPMLYLASSGWQHNNYYKLIPELLAWGLCFTLSISFYYLVNKKKT